MAKHDYEYKRCGKSNIFLACKKSPPNTNMQNRACKKSRVLLLMRTAVAQPEKYSDFLSTRE
jgi:hypothetical protein